MTKLSSLAAALLLLAVPALAQTPERGAVPEPHDSNSLHKLGKSIQYPVRKAGENVSKSTRKGAKDVQYGTRKNSQNLSVTTHRVVTGKNSVERRKNGAARHNTVVTPGGHLHRLPN